MINIVDIIKLGLSLSNKTFKVVFIKGDESTEETLTYIELGSYLLIHDIKRVEIIE